MSDTKYTPGDLIAERLGKELYLAPATGGFVADMQLTECDGEAARIRAIADAERLTTCWNAHDDLLAALRGLLAFVGYPCTTTGRLHTEESCPRCCARAALAKAGAK